MVVLAPLGDVLLNRKFGSVGLVFAVRGYGPSDVGSVVVGVSTLGAPGNNDPPPSNDRFDNRTVIATGVTVVGSSVGATVEPGEPAGLATVWYSWTPSVTGGHSVSTAGSAFPTVVGVYTGSSVASMSPVSGLLLEGTDHGIAALLGAHTASRRVCGSP